MVLISQGLDCLESCCCCCCCLKSCVAVLSGQKHLIYGYVLVTMRTTATTAARTTAMCFVDSRWWLQRCWTEHARAKFVCVFVKMKRVSHCISYRMPTESSDSTGIHFTLLHFRVASFDLISSLKWRMLICPPVGQPVPQNMVKKATLSEKLLLLIIAAVVMEYGHG